MTRVRTRTKYHTSGQFIGKYLGQPDVNFGDNCELLYEQCTDQNTSPGVDHALFLEARDSSGLNGISGLCPSGIFAGSEFIDFYPDGYHGTIDHETLSEASLQDSDFATLLARTNPSRPVVTPLTLIQDVVDLPKMLKDAGRLMKKGTKGLSAKDIANQNLAVQFGWLPLIDDVKKLLNLQKHMHDRAGEVHRLYSRSGLKRRIQLASASKSSDFSQNLSMGGAGATVLMKYHRYTGVSKWGTVRWKPTALPPYRSDTPDQNLQIFRAVSGLSPEGLLQGAWDVLPWTWLVDWFTDAGDYLLQHSNTIPAVSSHANVMISQQSVVTCRKTGGTSWLEVDDGTVILSTKSRAASGSGNFARIPHIGVRRLSILASLFVQRFK